jgi:hypothetical protein
VAAALTTYSPGSASCTGTPRRLARPEGPSRSRPAAAPKRTSAPVPARISSSGVPEATSRPRSTITTRSARRSASSRSWVASRTVVPSVRSWRTTSRMAARPCGSTPAVGSSRNATSGRPTSARPRARRRCSPPESWRQVRRSRPARPTRSSTSPGSRGRGYRAAAWRSASSGRIPGCTPPDCSITPIRPARVRWSVAGSSPATRTRPPARRRRPSSTSTVEVLPAPFGPSTTVTWAASAASASPSTATTGPYRTTRSSTSTAAMDADATSRHDEPEAWGGPAWV